MKNVATKFVGQNGLFHKSETVNNPACSARSLPKSDEGCLAEREEDWLTNKIEINKMKENVKFFVEENSALRNGMHEILDSIRNQDGNVCNNDQLFMFYVI